MPATFPPRFCFALLHCCIAPQFIAIAQTALPTDIIRPAASFVIDPKISGNGQGELFCFSRGAAHAVQGVQSDDGGRTWGSVRNAHGNQFPYGPELAHVGNGNYVAAWFSEDGPTPDTREFEVYSCRYSAATGWNEVTRVNSTGATDLYYEFDRDPKLAWDGHSTIGILWVYLSVYTFGDSYFDLFFSRSNDGGVSWSPAQRIAEDVESSTGTTEDFQAEIAADGHGGWVAVWQNRNTSEIHSSHSADNGATWASPARLGRAYSGSTPLVGFQEGSWSVILGRNPSRRYTSTDGETWNESPLQLPLAGDRWLTTDGRGHWIVSNEIGISGDLRVTTSYDNGETWSSLLEYDSTELNNGTVNSLVVAQNGEWIATGPYSAHGFFLIRSGPAATISTTAPDPVPFRPIPVTVQFTRDVVGLTLNGLELTNASASNLRGAGARYSFDVHPQSAGAVHIRLPEGAARDAEGRPTMPSNILQRTYAQEGPRATAVNPYLFGPTRIDDVPFVVVFDEEVQGFDSADDLLVVHSATSHAGVTISGGPKIYTLFLTGVSGDGPLTVAVSAESDVRSLQDVPLSGSVTSHEVLMDNTAPRVLFSSDAPAHHNRPVVSVTATLSEPVQSFSPLHIQHENARLEGIFAEPPRYEFTLAPYAEGVHAVHIRGSVFRDFAGNYNEASSLQQVYDASPPVLSNVTVQPQLVPPGGNVRIGFRTNEPLDGPPAVFINGQPGAPLPQKSDSEFSLAHALPESSEPGPANVQIIANDLAGNLAAVELANAFTIVGEGTPLTLGRWSGALLALGLATLLRRWRK